MAHHTEHQGFPALPLVRGMRLKLEARAPATDAEVAGVDATRWSIYGYEEGTATADGSDAIPHWVAEEP